MEKVTHYPTGFAEFSFVNDGLLDFEEGLLNMRSVGVAARVKICDCLKAFLHESVVG